MFQLKKMDPEFSSASRRHGASKTRVNALMALRSIRVRPVHEPLFVSRDISTSRPCERRDPYGEDSRFGAGAEAFFHF
ncbi:MAG TPA: hypothetical protein VN831_23400 [Bradyrhizobium sp.]|nr:hypothetical protein [Bradyrhizobium sp.]